MTDQPKELLRRIEEALDVGFADRFLLDAPREIFREAKQALASLKSMLEGDAGEDERILENALKIAEGCWTEAEIKIWKAALCRLSLKAKIGEAKIREAKIEVLEKVRERLLAHRWLGDEGQIAFLNRVIDEEIKHTAIKEVAK